MTKSRISADTKAPIETMKNVPDLPMKSYLVPGLTR